MTAKHTDEKSESPKSAIDKFPAVDIENFNYGFSQLIKYYTEIFQRICGTYENYPVYNLNVHNKKRSKSKWRKQRRKGTKEP